MSVRLPDGTKELKQKHMLLCNINEAFCAFKHKYPDSVISFSSFAVLRPKQVILAGDSGTHRCKIAPQPFFYNLLCINAICNYIYPSAFVFAFTVKQSCEMSNILHRQKFELKVLPQKRVNPGQFKSFVIQLDIFRLNVNVPWLKSPH